MKEVKSLLFLFVILSLLFFSGCSDVDCTKKDTTYEKYSFSEQEDKCVISSRIEKDECGNGIAEDGETYCNCKKDVSKTHPEFGCDGDIGDYLEKSCNDDTKECDLFQNKKVIEEEKSLQFKNSDVIFDVRVTLMNPFILNSADKNKIKVDISLFKLPSISNNIKNIVIKEFKIENSQGVLLGNKVYNEQISNIGDKVSTVEIALNDIKKYSSLETLRVKLDVSYTKDTISRGEVVKTEDKIETLISSIGRVEIINPNFYEE